MFITYSPFEYLCISIANAFGYDKWQYEDRIEWVCKNHKQFRQMTDQADDKALFVRGVLELERLKSGVTNSGYMMGLDGCASGIQVLSALTGDITGASQVGMVDPYKRCDVYTALGEYMNEFLPEHAKIVLEGSAGMGVFTRSDLKYPLMTHYYGSSALPKSTFGEGSLHLMAFYEALRIMCPGAEQMKAAILNVNKLEQNAERTYYNVRMPDGFQTFFPIYDKAFKHKVELEELKNLKGNNSTFTHQSAKLMPNPLDVSLVANLTHACDSLIVREIKAMANHDKEKLQQVLNMTEGCRVTDRYTTSFVSIHQANRLLEGTCDLSTDNEFGLLRETIEFVLDKPTFPIITVHDEFKSYPKYMNEVRMYYNDILARMTDSNLAGDLLGQLYDVTGLVTGKMSANGELSGLIRNCNYTLS